MDFNQLRYYSTLAKYKRMADAADELRMSQSALSLSMSKLETEVGVPLFNRTPKGIRLNDAGEEFLDMVDDLLNRNAETLQRLQEETNAHEVRFRTESRISSSAFELLLSDFQILHPEFSYTHTTTILMDFNKQNMDSFWNSADLYMTGLEDIPDYLDSKILRSDHLNVAISDQDPLAAQRSIYCRDLAGRNFITSINSDIGYIFERCCRMNHSVPANIYRLNDVYSTAQLISVGKGYTVTTHSASSYYFSQLENIRVLPLADENCVLNVRAVWRKELYQKEPLLKLLIDYIIQNYAQKRTLSTAL